MSSCLSVGRGFQEAEAVPEALAGETEFDLFLQDGGGALQNHLVILWTAGITHSAVQQTFHFACFSPKNFFLKKSFLFVFIFSCTLSLFSSGGSFQTQLVQVDIFRLHCLLP